MDHPHAHYMLTPDELIEKLEAERAALVAEVDRLRTEPPNDEPSKAEIEAALEAVQHYYMLFGDLHGKSIRLSERTVREILTTALRAAVAARRVRPQPPNED